jgi:uncharacterized protein (TIGR02284 family)
LSFPGVGSVVERFSRHAAHAGSPLCALGEKPRNMNYRTKNGVSLEYANMNSKSTTDVVNDLLQVLEDGKEGFRKAAEAVKDPNLKVVLSEFADERAQMAEELLRFTPAEPEEAKPTIMGAVHRGWIELKSALTSGDDHAILAECERGEDHAVEAFKKALEQELPSDVRQEVKSQAARVLKAHDRVKELRDAAHAIS